MKIIKNLFALVSIILIFNTWSYAQIKFIDGSLGLNLSKLDYIKNLNDNLDYRLVTIDTISDTNTNVNRRKFYFSFNTGFPEITSLGCGYQYSNEWSFLIKFSLSSTYYSSGGISLRVARFFLINLPFNNISVQPTIPLFTPEGRSYHFGPNGFSFEIGIGNESINKSKLDFFWSFGGIISTIKKEKPLYYLSLKLGLNWNF